jgi:hypothetical protein
MVLQRNTEESTWLGTGSISGGGGTESISGGGGTESSGLGGGKKAQGRGISMEKKIQQQ